MGYGGSVDLSRGVAFPSPLAGILFVISNLCDDLRRERGVKRFFLLRHCINNDLQKNNFQNSQDRKLLHLVPFLSI
jgi:hypothetical protein